MSWQDVATAPRDGQPFIADTGYPWATIAAWNGADQRFVSVDLQAGLCNGEWNDIYFENDFLCEVKRWQPLPQVKP